LLPPMVGQAHQRLIVSVVGLLLPSGFFVPSFLESVAANSEAHPVESVLAMNQRAWTSFRDRFLEVGIVRPGYKLLHCLNRMIAEFHSLVQCALLAALRAFASY